MTTREEFGEAGQYRRADPADRPANVPGPRCGRGVRRASTLLAEHASPKRQGFFTSFAQTGVQIGLLTGTIVFLLVESLGEETVLAWAWRIPFWFSFLLIAVALYVRLRVAESPVFKKMAAKQATVKLPVRTLRRRSPVRRPAQ